MEEILNKKLGWPGRMISGSKSGYRRVYPENFVIFNANLCTQKEKIWYGDLDLTKDKDILSEIAKELNETLYVLYEMDARFENENNFNIENAAAIFTSDGKIMVGDKYKKYHKL